MIRILAIAPYQGMCELMSAMAEKHREIRLTALVGDLEEGLQLARRAIEGNHYDIIISRGGTAELISRSLDIPVLDISTSLGDILQAVKLAENSGASFAIVGFPSITSRAELICEMLKYRIDVYTIENEADLPRLLQDMKQVGRRLIIGDTVTVELSKSMGFNALLITSNAETIESAFGQAVKLCQSYARRNAQYALHQSLVENAPQRVAVFRKNGECLFSTLEQGEEDKALMDYAQGLLVKGTVVSGALLERQMEDCLARFRPVCLDVGEEKLLAVYMDQRPLPVTYQSGVVMTINRQEAVYGQINHYYGMEGAAELRAQIDRYAAQSMPVLVSGEPGTGKDSVAFHLYASGPYSHRPLYVIDCALISEKQLDTLLESDTSPFNEMHVTILFQLFTKLSESQRERLILYASQSNLPARCRLIFSMTVGQDARNDGTARVVECASGRMGAVLLRLPPLRERCKDIPALAVLYISQYNAELGKQVIGLEPEALAMLEAYDWPYNLDQLQRVLRQLVSVSNTIYISAESMAEALRAERAAYVPSSGGALDLKRPMDDIMYDVVRMVLREEGNNQKRTAERLHISRSTLWRIMKAHEE